MRPLAMILFLLLLTSQPAALAAGAGEGCLKMVFGDYCLGGSMQQQMQRRPGGIPAPESGERSAVVYPQGRERTYVMAFQGRIYKVLHTYEPANQSKLRELKRRLETKYGDFLNQSHYPPYARTQASQIGAIRRGEGELRYLWQSSLGSYRVELAWSRKLGISIAYIATELDRKQDQAQESLL
jgi:hypothetical protein